MRLAAGGTSGAIGIVPGVDIQVRPSQPFGHEAAQEQRRGDAAGMAAGGGVVDIGDRAVQVAHVRPVQRHAPERIGCVSRGFEQLRRQGFIVGIQAGQIRAQSDAGGAGEGGKIQHQLRLPLRRISECIAQHQPAFGVGIADLHAQALARGDHLAGPERIRPDGVLDRRNQHLQAHRKLVGHHKLGQAQGMGGATHVLLHPQHAGGRLQVQATGIKAHALADQGQARMAVIAPVQLDQARGTMTGAANGVDGGKVLLQQRFALDHADRAAMPAGQFTGGFGQFGRTQVLGRGIDQIAHPVQRGQLGPRRGQHILGQAQLRRLALGTAVALELVGAQPPGQGRLGRVERHALAVVGQPVASGWQVQRQAAEQVRIIVAVDAGEHAVQPALLIGQQADRTRVAAEAAGLGVLRCRWRQPGQQRIQAITAHQDEGTGGGIFWLQGVDHDVPFKTNEAAGAALADIDVSGRNRDGREWPQASAETTESRIEPLQRR